MCQRIALPERDIWLLLGQSYICVRELLCRSEIYDYYWVRVTYVPENCSAGARYMIIIVSELHMCQRIALPERDIWLLLCQSYISARELLCRSEIYDYYWVRITYVPENCFAGARYMIIIESEFHMCQRISLSERDIWLLLSQSCIYARELLCQSEIYDYYWVRFTYVPENFSVGARYMIIIESELHICQRIALPERDIWLLLSQIYILVYARELLCRSEIYDYYCVRVAYVPENRPVGTPPKF